MSIPNVMTSKMTDKEPWLVRACAASSCVQCCHLAVGSVV